MKPFFIIIVGLALCLTPIAKADTSGSFCLRSQNDRVQNIVTHIVQNLNQQGWESEEEVRANFRSLDQAAGLTLDTTIKAIATTEENFIASITAAYQLDDVAHEEAIAALIKLREAIVPDDTIFLETCGTKNLSDASDTVVQTSQSSELSLSDALLKSFEAHSAALPYNWLQSNSASYLQALDKKRIKDLAAEGNTNALLYMADFHLNGINTPENTEKAASLVLQSMVELNPYAFVYWGMLNKNDSIANTNRHITQHYEQAGCYYQVADLLLDENDPVYEINRNELIASGKLGKEVNGSVWPGAGWDPFRFCQVVFAALRDGDWGALLSYSMRLNGAGVHKSASDQMVRSFPGIRKYNYSTSVPSKIVNFISIIIEDRNQEYSNIGCVSFRAKHISNDWYTPGKSYLWDNCDETDLAWSLTGTGKTRTGYYTGGVVFSPKNSYCIYAIYSSEFLVRTWSADGQKHNDSSIKSSNIREGKNDTILIEDLVETEESCKASLEKRFNAKRIEQIVEGARTISDLPYGAFLTSQHPLFLQACALAAVPSDYEFLTYLDPVPKAIVANMGTKSKRIIVSNGGCYVDVDIEGIAFGFSHNRTHRFRVRSITNRIKYFIGFDCMTYSDASDSFEMIC